LVLVAAALPAAPVLAGAATVYEVRPASSPVGFLATGKPGFLKIKGEGARLSGTATLADSTLSGTFEVELKSLATGIELRDAHMKDKYLEVGSHPTARLVLSPLRLERAEGKVEKPFDGTLTIKGVTKPVAGTVALDFAGDVVTGEARMEVVLSDYPVGVPSYLGVTVAETVAVTVQIDAVKVGATPAG
jgi:polyisoprenoid-binding protein YceI